MRVEFDKEERERKLRYVQQTFMQDFGKVQSRFIAEVVTGMTECGSVRLTEIARALKEDVALHATRKRLSRNLGRERLEKVVGDRVLELGSGAIGRDTLLVIVPSRLSKKYAKSMEFLDDLQSEYEETISKGYSLCEAVGCEMESKTVTPLAEVLWSRNAPDALSETDQILSLVSRVRRATEGRGIVAYRCPIDNSNLLTQWTADPACRYVLRLEGEGWQLLHKKRVVPLAELTRLCDYSYGDMCHKVAEDGLEGSYFVRFGFLPVRLPECPDRPLWLVLLHSTAVPSVFPILTTEPMRRNRRVLQWAIEAEHTASITEHTTRIFWQSIDFDDVRVLGYKRLKNIAALALLNSQYVARLKPELILSKSRLQFRNGTGALSPSSTDAGTRSRTTA